MTGLQSAAVILAATMSPQIHPAGFRISDRPVAASFAHPYSFQLVADPMLRDEAAIKSSVAIGGSEGSFARYWDESATVAALEFEVAVPVETTMSEAKEKKKKVKGMPSRPSSNRRLICSIRFCGACREGSPGRRFKTPSFR